MKRSIVTAILLAIAVSAYAEIDKKEATDKKDLTVSDWLRSGHEIKSITTVKNDKSDATMHHYIFFQKGVEFMTCRLGGMYTVNPTVSNCYSSK
ncbi:exported hypothetical protein [Gammaproteobacteria bacterium]